MPVPAVAVTLGDPGGIGPEVAAKALARPELLPDAAYVVFGDAALLEREARAQGFRLEIKRWDMDAPPAPGVYSREGVESLPASFVRGQPDRENGRLSFAWFELAVASARRGEVAAMVTAPVSKTSWSLAGIPHRGHTEYLALFFPKAVMSFWADDLRVALLSHHLPLVEALQRVNRTAILDFLRTLHGALAGLEGGPPELLVAGLNPHAGEGGLLGREDDDEVLPAVRAAVAEGIRATGPHPPDTVFLQALGRPDRMVVALYHDQGLIGFKLTAFDRGVNVTLGLPFPRTSPDHGTAFDIAGRGDADPRSMVESIKLAVRLLGSPSA